MKEWLKDYFSFTKKERTGAIVLSILIIAIFIAPNFFRQYYTGPDETELKLIRSEIGLIKQPNKDSSEEKNPEQYTAREKYNNPESAISEKLFRFDPNTLSIDGWKKLGVKEKVIQTIRHYIDKGGKFRRAKDLKRIYGLKPEQADRLILFVEIKNPVVEDSFEKKEKSFRKDIIPDKPNKFREYKKTIIDINLADTTAWIDLPGIGSKLAARIINFREKLGGFYSIDQVGETFGLADSVFQKIKSRLQISAMGVKQIEINKASFDELKQHPYIRWNIAQAIVRYREQHGPFIAIADLSQINIIDNELLRKIKPYLIFN